MNTSRHAAPRALVVMRHCKSDWEQEELDDFDRPLSRRGIKDARRMGELLERSGLRPDLILASPSARTRHTVEIVAGRCGYRGEILWRQELYNTEGGAYIAALRALGSEVSLPLVVGHNPALEEALAELTGGRVRLPTGALLRLDLGTGGAPLGRWADLASGSCTLMWLLAPRLLKAIR